MKKLTLELIEELAEDLMGTTQSIGHACDLIGIDEDELYDNIDMLGELDQLVLLCDACGWWVESGDIVAGDGENICCDCDETEEEGE